MLKVELSVVEDMYPDTTTVDIRVSCGRTQRQVSEVKHFNTSYFQSAFELAMLNMTSEVKRMMLRNDDE